MKVLVCGKLESAQEAAGTIWKNLLLILNTFSVSLSQASFIGMFKVLLSLLENMVKLNRWIYLILSCLDEHEENKDLGQCTLLMALMQEHRRSAKACRPPLLPIAYFIYKVWMK